MKSTAAPWPLRACPRVVTAGRFTQQDRGFAREYRNDTLTIHLFAYAATVRIGDAEHAVRPGDLTITPAWRSLRFDIDRPGVHWCLRVQPPAAIPGAARMSLAPLHRLGAADGLEARRRIETVIADHGRAVGDPDHPAAVAAGLAAQNLLCWLAARADQPAAPRDAVEKARLLLANPQCLRVPISEVARRSGMSQNRLALAFRRRHGTSMAQYRTRCRIELAMHLMQTSDRPMAAIRRSVELPDAHHFNRVFRRVAGVGPRAWRAAQGPLFTSTPR